MSRSRLLAIAWWCALALAGALGAVAANDAAAKPPAPFATGFADGIYEDTPNPNLWATRTLATGATFVLMPADWASIAFNRPSKHSNPSSPSNPDYNWGTLDTAVRAATSHGLTVALSVASGGGGPAWADGPNRPKGAPPGTWKPNPRAFGAFAKAVARRYSGSYKAGGTALPRVRYYQAWGEPNLSNHLTPQWTKVRGQWRAESPIIYRRLLNAFYAGVTSVHSNNLVIAGGTAPYGDGPGLARMQPARFVRALLCVNGPHLSAVHCPDPAHFNILAHDPYEIGGPYQKAINPDDVTVPDFGKLTGPLHAAERDGLALPRGRKKVWATEFSWDSKPPDPQGVPAKERAYWIEESFHEMWQEGVSAVAWFLIRDQPPVPSYSETYQSGMYFTNGKLKPGLVGFRFPFVVGKAQHGRRQAWGLSPVGGKLLIQKRGQNGWRTLLALHVRAHAVFARWLRLGSGVRVRAVVDGNHSLVWPER